MMPDEAEELARRRWGMIQLVRLMGVGLVILGILMLRDVVDFTGDAQTNRWVGYGFLGIGFLDVFLMPLVLARKWRSPNE